MNPSSFGWIKKLLNELERINFSYFSNDSFYLGLRECGFIYGNNIKIVENLFEKKDFTEEELCKINLCIAFLNTHNNSNTNSEFLESVIDFYTKIDAIKTSFFHNLLGGKKSYEQLEKILHKRIQVDANVLTKNFNHFITNVLLYSDILAYNKYLETKTISTNYLKQLEAAVAQIVLSTLNTKNEKTKYDDSLIKLFESSSRYQNNDTMNFDTAVEFLNKTHAKNYVLDLVCMASWTDKIIDEKETMFLNKLGTGFGFNKEYIQNAINSVTIFYTENESNIALLSSKNIVQSFYNNSSRIVKKLISRNSKRLYKELTDSKELMILLTQSTVRDLNDEEQKKVQEQLLDIFKSIPSLAIFMLPGGMILLPLVIKFIPKLLPSAFDENRIENDD